MLMSFHGTPQNICCTSIFKVFTWENSQKQTKYTLYFNLLWISVRKRVGSAMNWCHLWICIWMNVIQATFLLSLQNTFSNKLEFPSSGCSTIKQINNAFKVKEGMKNSQTKHWNFISCILFICFCFFLKIKYFGFKQSPKKREKEKLPKS